MGCSLFLLEGMTLGCELHLVDNKQAFKRGDPMFLTPLLFILRWFCFAAIITVDLPSL